MRLCLRCGYMAARLRDNQEASALFCQGCGRTYRCRIDERGHVSQPNALFCRVCGSQSLSESTPYLDLTFLPRIVAVLCLAAACRIFWHNGRLLLCLTIRAGIGGIAALFGVQDKAVWTALASAASWAFLILIGSLLIPGGKQVRHLLGRALGVSARTAWRVVSAAWFGLVVGGRTPKKEKRQQ